MRNLSLDQLRTLIEVVALGSFTEAAKRLHLTQPAISQQIRELENRCGMQLVERIVLRVPQLHQLFDPSRRPIVAVDGCVAGVRGSTIAYIVADGCASRGGCMSPRLRCSMTGDRVGDDTACGVGSET